MLINEMIIFYYVVQLKSFSQAAIKLKVSKSHISKHITLLETELKVKLLNRSTRKLSLTEEGDIFFKHCQTVFEQAQLGYDVIAGLRKQATGTLKISVPPAFGLHRLQQPLIDFIKAHPEVNLNIVLNSSIENIIEQGYDLALRYGNLADSNLMAHKIGSFKNILCASPLYLQEYGEIKTPAQLPKHKFAVFSSNNLLYELTFSKGKQEFQAVVTPYLQSNSLDFILQMVIAGNCIAEFPEFMVKHLLIEQTLIACLPNYKTTDNQLSVIYPDKKFIPLRVKSFVALLKTYLDRI